MRLQPTIATAMFAIVHLSGCAGWQATSNTTLAATFQATKGVSKLAEATFDRRCSAEIRGCKEIGLDKKQCEAGKICVDQFKKTNEVIKTIHMAIAIARSLIALSDEKKAAVAVLRATDALLKLYNMAHKYGVIKWTP